LHAKNLGIWLERAKGNIHDCLQFPKVCHNLQRQVDYYGSLHGTTNLRKIADNSREVPFGEIILAQPIK
jgi:hypothetical protein